MERTMISWNFPNLFTVVLMAAAGYALLAVISQVILNRQPGGGMGE